MDIGKEGGKWGNRTYWRNNKVNSFSICYTRRDLATSLCPQNVWPNLCRIISPKNFFFDRRDCVFCRKGWCFFLNYFISFAHNCIHNTLKFQLQECSLYISYSHSPSLAFCIGQMIRFTCLRANLSGQMVTTVPDKRHRAKWYMTWGLVKVCLSVCSLCNCMLEPDCGTGHWYSFC